MNSLAHLCFALAFSEAFALQTIPVSILSLAPDIDFYFTHRGFLHNPLLPLAALLFIPRKNRSSLFGYFSHLLLDLLTPMGIPFLFTRFTANLPWLEPFVIAASLAVVFSKALQGILRKNIKLLSLATACALLLVTSPTVPFVSPARLILGNYNNTRAITYGFAEELSWESGGDSSLSMDGYTIAIDRLQLKGPVMIEGIYKKGKMMRAKPAPLFSS